MIIVIIKKFMDNSIEEEREKEPNLEALKEAFKEELLVAADIPREFGGRAVFNDLESFSGLVDHPEIIEEILRDEFDFNRNAESLVSEYSMQGTRGEPGEGEIKVRVFRTKDPEIFVGEYEYQNGDKVLVLRPEKLDDEDSQK